MELVEGIATVKTVDDFVDALAAIGEEYSVTVQAFDARYVVSRQHIKRALDLADRERERGNAIADDRAVEILLYAAGRRQINQAMELGITTGETPIVVLVAAKDERHDGPDESNSNRNGVDRCPGRGEGSEPAEQTTAQQTATDRETAARRVVADLLTPARTLRAYDETRVRSFFDIGDLELAATDATLADLVLERVALLVVNR